MNDEDFQIEVMVRLERIENALTTRTTAPKSAPYPVSPVADAAELDSKFGDVEIRKDPPRWKGESFAGKRYSQCPIEYLETMASFLDWKAAKDSEKGTADGDKYANYARKDAARCRGWIARKESGWTPPAPSSELFSGDDPPF